MKKNQKKSKNKSNSNPILQLAIIIIVFAVGVGVGSIINKPSKDNLELASEAKIQIARMAIMDGFLNQSSKECSYPTDPINPQDRVQVFQEYLQINKYANRAVIRGCNDIDYLLAKNSAGEWIITDVNVSLDARANPKWQKECLIDDITEADDVIRPENSTIDEMNFELCKELRSN